MTQDGLNSLTYDAENRAVTAAGATYSYDGNSLRVKKVLGGTTTVYIFSGSKVVAEYLNGSLAKEYVYSGGALIAVHDGATLKYQMSDHLSARLITDSTGTIVAQQAHYPFGETWYQGAAGTKWQFTTYERDAESGNDYAMFRYHVNRLGRFNAPDPIAGSVADPQSLNRYRYVRNDPVNLIDPLGLHILHAQVDPAVLDAFREFHGLGASPVCVSFTVGRDTESPRRDSFCSLVADRPPRDPGDDPISEGLKKLKTLLPNDPDCLAFLNSQKMDALSLLQGLADHNLVGKDSIAPKIHDGTISITNAQTPGTQVGQAITLNTIGAFFNASYQGIPLTTDRGRIPGGTQPAQLFILLHELGHITNVLSHDKDSQKAVDRNDKLLEQHCKKTIKAFGR